VLDGRYRIETIIAQGGMAILYRAHQIGMDRTVAIKVMLPTFAPNSQAAERFAQECKLAARLNHPNIVAVHDVGMIGPQQPYLVMEYIDGVSLSNELSEHRPPLTTALTIICQVLKGLEEAHGAGIIHRDLKSDNILLQRKSSDRSDWVKIVDFGIANLADRTKRLTKTGSFIGTPAYMAPEQFRGKAIDTRVDIYAVGIVMFEVLTGNVPFDGDSPDIIMMKHLIEEPPSLSESRTDVPPQIEAVMRKALAKDAGDRFQTATDFRVALEACQGTV
jgi:serine/threonine-protein kinase